MNMKNYACDVLYLAGNFDYGDSVSGNYLLHKCIESVPNIEYKAIVTAKRTKAAFNRTRVIEFPNCDLKTVSDDDLLKIIPSHKILILSSSDLSPRQIHLLHTTYNNIVVYYLMTHDLLGNGSGYPELANDFSGSVIDEKMNYFNNINLTIICASTHSSNIVAISPFRRFAKQIIPLPFDEIPAVADRGQHDRSPTASPLKALGCLIKGDLFSDRRLRKNLTRIGKDGRKNILWGTTQPATPRKGLALFNEVLELLLARYPEAGDKLQVISVGPAPAITAKVPHISLGPVANREQLSLVYHAADVFACTTISDAGPMMVCESIKNNCPVIGFDRSILLDVVGDNRNGVVIPELNLELFADKLYEALFLKRIEIDHAILTNFNSQSAVNHGWSSLISGLLSGP